jgi:hypothetical protein
MKRRRRALVQFPVLTIGAGVQAKKAAPGTGTREAA